jgi:hypothetical protein
VRSVNKCELNKGDYNRDRVRIVRKIRRTKEDLGTMLLRDPKKKKNEKKREGGEGSEWMPNEIRKTFRPGPRRGLDYSEFAIVPLSCSRFVAAVVPLQPCFYEISRNVRSIYRSFLRGI